MKSIIAALCVIVATNMLAQVPCVDGFAGDYPCRNMDLLKFMTIQECGCSPNGNTNDVWGWKSPSSGREYAILGCADATSFIDVSDPVNPVVIGVLPTHTVSSLWRDVEAHNNWLFVVSEADGHGMQIFDLNQLDAVANPPIEFDETAHYPGFSNCHTVNVDPVSGFVFAYGTNTYGGGEHIVDVSDPLNPQLAGGYDASGYTHDGFAWTYDGPDTDHLGKEIVIACNGRANSENDRLVLLDVTDKTDCQLIGEYNYNGEATTGYFHQGWITKNKRYFLMNDELDESALGEDQLPYGTRTHIFNIADLDNVTYEGFYEAASPAIDHNLYALDQFIYESNYRSGVRVLDAIRIASSTLSEVAFFDLYPQNDNAQFSGTWSNYPYLPSGIVLATSMYDGFFILRPTIITTSQDTWEVCNINEVTFDVDINANLAFPLTVGLSGMESATATASQINGQGVVTVTISGLGDLSPGNYSPNLLLISDFGEQYEIPLEFTVCSINSVDEISKSALEIYPNPAKAEVRLDFKQSVESIEILDAAGKLFKSVSVQGNRTMTLDLRDFAAGMYTVRAGQHSARMVVE